MAISDMGTLRAAPATHTVHSCPMCSAGWHWGRLISSEPPIFSGPRSIRTPHPDLPTCPSTSARQTRKQPSDLRYSGGLGVDMMLSQACSCGRTGNMCASLFPSTPASTRFRSVSARASDHGPLATPSSVDSLIPSAGLWFSKTAADHADLRRQQFRQLPEGEMGLRRPRDPLYLDRNRHPKWPDPHARSS